VCEFGACVPVCSVCGVSGGRVCLCRACGVCVQVGGYTVTTDATTARITIASDGAGGGGILTIFWTDSVSDEMADILGFDTGTDDTGALTYTAETLKIHTSEHITFDFGISTNVDAFILAGDRNSPLKITNTSTIKLEANETSNFVDATPSFTTTLTYDDFTISKFRAAADAGLATEALRFWRVTFLDEENPNTYVQVGAIFLGDFFQSTTGAPQFPLQSRLIDRSETVFSEGGETFSDIQEQSRSFTIRYFALTTSEVESLIAIFENFGIAVPLFVTLDPNAAFTSTVNSSIVYAKFETAPSINLVRPDVYEMVMTMREEL